MLSNNDKTRKWRSLLPSPTELFPAFHLRIKIYFPLLAALLLSLVWGGLIAQKSLTIHRSFQTLTSENSLSPNSFDVATAQPVAINIAAATALNLFGKVEVKPTEIDPATLPSTTANLKLVGLFASSQSGASRGLISEQDKPAKSYAEGDKLPSGLTVFKIENDCVIVQRGDQYEKLALPTSLIGKSAAPAPNFAEIAQAQMQAAASAPPPTVSTREADGNAGPQSIYRALDASLAALKKKKS